jgi:hypothetical protein
MSQWSQFLAEVRQHLDELAESGCDMPFFRGHSDHNWKLLCGLGRQAPSDFKKQNIESILYYDFTSLGGGLLGKRADSWDVLFAMQHHGLPTRLLDWTTTFSAALYFALRPYLFVRNFPEIKKFPTQPCVWVLDPFELNRLAQREPAVANPYIDFDGTYQENFIEQSKSLGADVVAINPPQHTPRQSAQRSVFTLHDAIFKPLDEHAGIALRKFEIPIETARDAVSFLHLAGINEFTIYPDLDGLSRYLKSEHVSWL